MSGVLNGYVFPPPCFPHTAFQERSPFASRAFGVGQDYPSTAQYERHPTNRPHLNGQSHYWPPSAEPSFPSTMHQSQVMPRMQGYAGAIGFPRKGANHFTPREPFLMEALHFKGPRKPCKHTNNRRNVRPKIDGLNEVSATTNSAGKFFCEPCEKDFKSENDKIAHVRQHVKCEVEECNFFASRKAVKLHFIQKHEVGKFRIVLKNDDDIEKWREERRRNYPSVTRKSERLAEEEARKCHGNVLKKRDFSYKGNGKWNRHAINSSHTLCIKQQPNTNLEIETVNADYTKQKDLGIPGEEREAQALMTNNLNERPKVQAENGLESLKHMYDSSDSEESDHDTTVLPEYQQNLKQTIESNCLPTESNKEPFNMDVLKNTKKEVNGGIEYSRTLNVQKGDIKSRLVNMSESMIEGKLSGRDGNNCRITERSIKLDAKSLTQNSKQRTSESRTFENSRKRKFPDKDKGNRQSTMLCNRKHRPTLLEMLLANDIKHERNAVLQCIRFITKNSFLNIKLEEL